MNGFGRGWGVSIYPSVYLEEKADCTPSLGKCQTARALIFRIAKHLRHKPRLLYGLNSVLQPHYRLESSTTVSEVNFFVLVDGKNSWILTFLKNLPSPLPASDIEVKNIISEREIWETLLFTCEDTQYLACLAQILQEVRSSNLTTLHYTGC